MRTFVSLGMGVALAALIGAWLSVEGRAQTADTASLAGPWTLNTGLSDRPSDRAGDDRGRRGDDGGFGRRGGGRGGFGGGSGGGRGGYGRGGQGNPEEFARLRDAMRDILNPPEHLVITETDSMIAITGPDGRTTRLSPDGKKIKDERSGVERRTTWEGGKLVSEISGLGPMKATQTYAVDPEAHQLRITVLMEGGRQPRTTTSVYDRDAR